MNLLDTRIIKDWLTGLDGETFALGRGLGVLYALLAAVVSVFVVLFVAFDKHPTAPEWGALLVGIGGFLVTVATAAWVMIRGTNATEPPAPPTT